MTNLEFMCIDCGKKSPEAEADGASTLISMKYGWRITRRIDGDGQAVVEPRCPACYAARKSAAKAG